MTATMAVEDVEARLSSLSAALAFLGVNAGCHCFWPGRNREYLWGSMHVSSSWMRQLQPIRNKCPSKCPRKEGTIRMSTCTCSTRTSILASSTACNWEYTCNNINDRRSRPRGAPDHDATPAMYLSIGKRHRTIPSEYLSTICSILFQRVKGHSRIDSRLKNCFVVFAFLPIFTLPCLDTDGGRGNERALDLRSLQRRSPVLLVHRVHSAA